MGNKFYLTTTLPYVNAAPHIGFALEIIQADVIARYHRLLGNAVFFNFGTDEHGKKIYDKAIEVKKDPKAYCDEYATKFDDLKQALNLSYNSFIRTTDPKHIIAAQEFWNRCKANGDIYKKNYKTKYCVGCELEKTDSELVDGYCPLHPNRDLEIIEEDDTKIIAKDFLNLKDVSITENIRRIDIIIRGMMEDMIKSVNNDASASIYERDFDVNRFCFLVLRAINGASRNPQLLRLLKIQNEELIPTWLLCLYLEDVADEIKRVSRFFKTHDFELKIKKELILHLHSVEKSYLDVMKSYYTQNYELAFKVDLVKDEIINDLNKFFEKYPVTGVARISERLKKMTSGIGSVAQVVYGKGMRRKG